MLFHANIAPAMQNKEKYQQLPLAKIQSRKSAHMLFWSNWGFFFIAYITIRGNNLTKTTSVK